MNFLILRGRSLLLTRLSGPIGAACTVGRPSLARRKLASASWYFLDIDDFCRVRYSVRVSDNLESQEVRAFRLQFCGAYESARPISESCPHSQLISG